MELARLALCRKQNEKKTKTDEHGLLLLVDAPTPNLMLIIQGLLNISIFAKMVNIYVDYARM